MSRITERDCSVPVSQRNAARAALLLATTALTSPGLLQPASAQNLPTGGSVAAGSVAITQQSATQLTITQSSQSAVVNWQGFSIGQGSTVNIAQSNASSAILNRVTGNTPSTIAGALTANGQVYLINPNGIAITATGTVNTGGFVASTLGISDADFMGGKRTFTGNGASAAVSNAGTITIGRGGYAALIGGTVSNSGTISVPLGKVGLGSGEQATLDFSGDGFLQVAMPTNAGGKGALIKNAGSITADGGSVIISAATAREAARNAVNISGLVQARSIGGHNGAITIGGGEGGKVRIRGRLDASSPDASGGKITVTGQTIKLKAATVDASGATGGGTINIGGGRQGSGPLMHADTVSIDAATTIKADATQSGNGGNVVVWSDLLTTFAGTISAKGGAVSGHGGEAEVSGKALLAYTGFTDLSAAQGGFGTLLLDPYNVTISSAADVNQSGFTATGNDSVINVTTLQNALAGANVTVSTGGAGSAGTQAGDITVANAVSWSSGTTLTLSAYRNIAVNANLSGGTGAGDVVCFVLEGPPAPPSGSPPLFLVDPDGTSIELPAFPGPVQQ
jgi:filamentous hemagglutinin family protein